MKKHLSILLFIFILTLLVACGTTKSHTPSSDTPDGELHKVSMRLQWIPQYQFAGYIVAKERGYYSDVGLDVALNPGSPDFVPMPLVVSGADSFGSTGADTIFQAREKDINVVALATIFQTSPVAFMVHSDSGIAGPEDFVDRNVGVFYGDNVETEYRALLKATGVDRSQVNEIPAQFNLEPFLSKRVDVWPVYATDQPDLAREQGAEVQLIVARDYGVTLMGDVLFTTEEFVQENPEITQAFVSATLQGWEEALAQSDETVRLIAAYNKQLSPKHLEFEAQETIGLVGHGAGATCPGWNDRATWDAEQEMLLELGLITQKIAFEDAVDNRFVEEYYREKGVECGE